MGADAYCKKIGLKGLAELHETSEVPKNTLISWFKSDKRNRAFKLLAIGTAYQLGRLDKPAL